MSSVYLSRAVQHMLADAQSELNLHMVSDAAGRCAMCQELEPCARRDALHNLFARYGRLPRRQPGLTHHGLRKLPVPLRRV